MYFDPSLFMFAPNRFVDQFDGGIAVLQALLVIAYDPSDADRVVGLAPTLVGGIKALSPRAVIRPADCRMMRISVGR
jgi:hypothetical protein